jgi:hypothetical protein
MPAVHPVREALTMFRNRTAPTQTLEVEGPVPPASYPFAEWVDEGPYAVPVEMRDLYATAPDLDEPTRARIMAGTGLLSEHYTDPAVRRPTLERSPLVTHARDLGAIVTIDEDRYGACHLAFRWRGSDGVTAQTHLSRMAYARDAHAADLKEAERAAARRTACPACGDEVASIAYLVAITLPPLGSVRVCSSCAPLLPSAVATAAAERDTGRARDVAAYARELLAE